MYSTFSAPKVKALCPPSVNCGFQLVYQVQCSADPPGAPGSVGGSPVADYIDLRDVLCKHICKGEMETEPDMEFYRLQTGDGVLNGCCVDDSCCCDYIIDSLNADDDDDDLFNDLNSK